jgi:hypothetical protein
MPQLSLYVDEETLKRIETGAKAENLSISKYVVTKVKESLEKRWPGNFFRLYGSVQDETFDIPEEIDFIRDSKREDL